MATLEELSQENGLDLVPAEWGVDKTLVVPSVTHWKENHFVAITEEKNGRYLTMDPTFGRPRWLLASQIQEEASGYFMVPKTKLPPDWRQLNASETSQIYGKGLVGGITDGDDCCGNGSGGSSGSSSIHASAGSN